MEEDLTFDWDDANIDHIGRHGITPSDIEEAFSSETTDLSYEVLDGEERWTSIGHTFQLRVLVVVWTMRGNSIRTVTAFQAGARLAAEYWRQKRG